MKHLLVLGSIVAWSAACGGPPAPTTAMKTTETTKTETTTVSEPLEKGDPQVTAPPQGKGLDKEQIRITMRANLPAVKACYEAQLAKDPAAAGTTIVTFIIDPSGTVSSSAGAGFQADVDTCVATVVKGLRFPTAEGATSVAYPFEFKQAEFKQPELKQP